MMSLTGRVGGAHTIQEFFQGLCFPSPHGLYFLLLFIKVRIFCVVSAIV